MAGIEGVLKKPEAKKDAPKEESLEELEKKIKAARMPKEARKKVDNELKKLKLDDKVLDHLKIKPFLMGEAKPDPRWKDITIRHCLQHTGGWAARHPSMRTFRRRSMIG